MSIIYKIINLISLGEFETNVEYHSDDIFSKAIKNEDDMKEYENTGLATLIYKVNRGLIQRPPAKLGLFKSGGRQSKYIIIKNLNVETINELPLGYGTPQQNRMKELWLKRNSIETTFTNNLNQKKSECCESQIASPSKLDDVLKKLKDSPKHNPKLLKFAIAILEENGCDDDILNPLRNWIMNKIYQLI